MSRLLALTPAAAVTFDHMVPLAEAWDSGARTWTAATRQEYANDLGDSRALVGVTDTVNQGKGDQDPREWLATYDVCRYLREWVAVKQCWQLSADSAEKTALKDIEAQRSCTGTITPHPGAMTCLARRSMVPIGSTA